MDGVDTALVRIQGSTSPTLELQRFEVYSYPASLRKKLWQATQQVKKPQSIPLSLDKVLGEFFAECAIRFLKPTIDKIEAIGSHGQTILHRPKEKFTIQLGNPQIIADLTGFTVVANFRQADMDKGGEGAPLVPLLDYYLFSHPQKGRLLVNLGGICNLTYLPPGGKKEDVMGFDVGPGNTLLDRFYGDFPEWLFATKKGRSWRFYNDGQWAAEGVPDEEFLEKGLKHPFFTHLPPKSADIHDFDDLYESLLFRLPLAKPSDFRNGCATLIELTARALHLGVTQFLSGTLHEIYLTGGGALNSALVSRIQSVFQEWEIPVMTGLPKPHKKFARPFPHKAKEAVLFALLAHHRLNGIPGNLPGVTGASCEVVLGDIYEPVSAA